MTTKFGSLNRRRRVRQHRSLALLQILCCASSFAPARIVVSQPLNPETNVGDQVGGR